MNYSYDYDELLEDIKGDLVEGLIKRSDKLKIVRSSNVRYENYKPLIDYYYLEDEPDEEYEEIKVSDVLLEIEYHNKIIK